MTPAERLEQLKGAALPLLSEHFGEESFQVAEHRDELSIIVPPQRLTELVGFLRDNESLRFNQLRDINAVDWNRRKDRFELIYNFYSLPNSWRIRVKCFTDEKRPHVDSICGLYTAANWYERETYDMHGIIFDGHPDLRRMYMPEDYVDPETGEPIYPLRKDYPVMGVPDALPLPDRNPVV